MQRTRRQRIKPAVGANSRHERPQTMSCPRSGVYLGEHGPCLQPLKSAPNVAASPRRLQCPLYNTLCPQLLGGKRAPQCRSRYDKRLVFGGASTSTAGSDDFGSSGLPGVSRET